MKSPESDRTPNENSKENKVAPQGDVSAIEKGHVGDKMRCFEKMLKK